MLTCLQCDGVRPACRKCVESNRECSGYLEGLDLVLRSQNQAAKAGVERRQKALIKKRTQSHETSQNAAAALTSAVALRNPLVESEESHALCFFISSHVLYPRDPQADRGIIELLPLVFANLRADTPLSLSLAAVSRCMYGAWERRIRDTETTEVRLAYGKALMATRHVLKDPHESTTDETLMAICLLGFYEVCLERYLFAVSSLNRG